MLKKEYAGFVITCSEQLNPVCLTFPGPLPYSNDHPCPGFLCERESPASGSSQEREEQWNVDYLLENFGCPARRELISFKGLSLILCEALRAYLYGQPRGQIFTVSWPPGQGGCLALKSFQWGWESTHQERKEMVQKKILHVQGNPAKLGESGTERRKGRKPGQMRRNCMNRAAGHAAFSSEKTFKMRGEMIPAIKLSRSTVLCLHANSGGESNRQAAKPWHEMLSVFMCAWAQYPSPWWWRKNLMAKNMDSAIRLPGFKSQLDHLLLAWL